MTRQGVDREGRQPVRALLWALVAVMLVVVVVLLYLWAQGPDPVPDAVRGLAPILIITGPESGESPAFTRPLSAAWGPTGDIFVSDTGNGRICVFGPRGRFVREFGRVTSDTPAAQREGALQQPAGIAVADDGTTYVADLRAGLVMVYNARGRFLRSIRPSALPTDTARWAPTDVAVFENVVAVTDAQGVVVFSVEGEFRNRITEAGVGSPFVRPNGVAFAEDGSMVVSDTNQTRVVSLAQDGELFWVLNGDAAGARSVGLPRGLTVAGDGSVFVADAFRFAIVQVSADGEYVDRFGEQGEAPGTFQFPNDVDVRKDLALVADKENNRVQVLRLVDILESE